MGTKQLTKTEIKKALLMWNGNRPFISITEIARSLKIGRDKARELVSGLGYIENGRRKDYLVDAVAERLYEISKC